MKTQILIRLLPAWGAAGSLLGSAVAAEVKFGAPQKLQVPGLEELEAPELVDFDGDGVRDLVSGNYGGNIIFRKNTGSDAEPKWAEPVKIQRGGEDIKLRHW